MKLTYSERLRLLNVLPAKTTRENAKRARKVQRVLELSDKEKEEINLTTIRVGDQIRTNWDESKDVEEEIELSKSDLRYLIKRFDELDKQGEYPTHLVEIEERIEDTIVEMRQKDKKLEVVDRD